MDSAAVKMMTEVRGDSGLHLYLEGKILSINGDGEKERKMTMTSYLKYRALSFPSISVSTTDSAFNI